MFMTFNEASQILEALAHGIDPETGELLPDNSILHNAHVVRALFIGAKALSQDLMPAQKRVEVEVMEQAWKPWTKDEEVRLVAAFKKGKSVEELAAIHKRKVGGIRSRLVKLQLINPSNPVSNGV